MEKVTIEQACSFAHSIDDQTADPGRFYEETAGWLLRENPVLATVVIGMANRLIGDNPELVNAVLSISGYSARLLDHAEQNRVLAWTCGEGNCPVENRRFCCHKRGETAATRTP